MAENKNKKKDLSDSLSTVENDNVQPVTQFLEPVKKNEAKNSSSPSDIEKDKDIATTKTEKAPSKLASFFAPFKKRHEKISSFMKATSYKMNYQEVNVDLSVNQDGTLVRKVVKKRPTKTIIAILVVILLFVFSLFGFNSFTVRLSWSGVGEMLASLFTPNPYGTVDWNGWWNYMGTVAIPSIWKTVELCLISTTIGSLVSIPAYYLSARNTAKSPWVYQPVRIINDLIRSIPMLIVALLAVKMLGYGSLPGIIAMSIFSLGIMQQLMYEYIETLEMSPFEAISASGGRTLQCINVGLHPEIKPMFFVNFLYTFEINIRGSIVLGYVSAGGFGQIIQDNINHHNDKVGALLVPLLLVVITLQLLTNFLARKTNAKK